MNLLLHASIAIIARHGTGSRGNEADFYLAQIGKKGWGMFARRNFAKGDLVYVMTGQAYDFESRSKLDSHRYENWLGIGKDRYIDPDPPFLYANHSCQPNLGIRGERHFIALVNIAAGDELTYDYSITTEELLWDMKCHCESQQCRGTISSIQSLPRDVFDRYLPFINPHFQLVYRRHRLTIKGLDHNSGDM